MARYKGKRVKKKAGFLSKSPINYFSDLFIMAMVGGWVITLVIMIGIGFYATIKLEDTGIWSYVEGLVTIPLSAGGALWMIKNSVTHAIANSKGKQAPFDFPKVNADGENDGAETLFEDEGSVG
ncbi:MAG: hypothetical protein NC548_56180 [Lachnospiraceae bacterium]|nr:hypothetical protein [Lachnospiraceae bacterium]